MTASERLRMVAITPLWAVCAAGWGATSALLLTWTSVSDRRGSSS